MELLNQMDGFDILGKVKMIMATNRPDTLDPALLRPGRLDRKIEIPLPNDQARYLYIYLSHIHESLNYFNKSSEFISTAHIYFRLEILKIHAGPITKHGEVDYEAVVKLSDGFNGADLRNVCTGKAMIIRLSAVGSLYMTEVFRFINEKRSFSLQKLVYLLSGLSESM